MEYPGPLLTSQIRREQIVRFRLTERQKRDKKKYIDLRSVVVAQDRNYGAPSEDRARYSVVINLALHRDKFSNVEVSNLV